MDQNLSIHTSQNKNSVYSETFFRILTDDFPQKKYKPKEKDQDRTTVHFGQRKLFLSEVEFLTNACTEIPKNKLHKKIVIVYAGAAPGIHIEYLSQMFPFVKFVLIDPAKMLVQPSEQIRIHQEYFTDESALSIREEFGNDLILFISDIRRFGPGANLTDSQLEDEITEDMRCQMNWYKMIQPFRSLLKFRLPYVENRPNPKLEIEYLQGDIYFQIWPPSSSSETRLYVRENACLTTYDCAKYENQLYRFNNVERVSCYRHNYDINGLDHCYDCRAEIYVFEQYMKNFSKLTRLCRRKETIKEHTIEEFVLKLNEHLDADKRLFRFSYDKKEYEIKFTDIKYGKKVDDLFINKNLVRKRFNKWEQKSYHYDHSHTLNRLGINKISGLKKSVQSKVVKRLNK